MEEWTPTEISAPRNSSSGAPLNNRHRRGGGIGQRVRVVNGKRTDLSELLISKCKRAGAFDEVVPGQLFQGHTRFATSSIANMLGCHPHTWSPPKQVISWRCNQDGVYEKSSVSHECFITHNGDLDFYEWHGTVYPLSLIHI